MKIEDYPRPFGNTGIGFCYFPDAEHYRRQDAAVWVPRLQAMRASWLVMQTPPTRPVPDAFLQRLMVADIEPVVMLKPAQVGPLEADVLQGTLRALADSGGRYVVLFDRPNDRESWSPSEWSKPALVERFVDFVAPALELVVAEGLIPVLPPLEPFGAYWDISFLQTMLASLRRRGLGALLERTAVGMRNFANNRPLDWGAGGPQAWPHARPYTEQVEGQDHRGIRLFEWYLDVIQRELGHPLPLLACANGPQSSRLGDVFTDPQVHARQAVEMAQLVVDKALPPAVMNHAFWLLAAERQQQEHVQAWFDADGSPRLPAVKALVEYCATLQRPAPSQEAVASVEEPLIGASSVTRPAVNGSKPIDHYLLLPVFEWGVSHWHLSIVQEYVEAYMPTLGFSLEEAKLARRVTIVGNEQGVGAGVERELNAAGCQVVRVAGENGMETQQLLQNLARNKQHQV